MKRVSSYNAGSLTGLCLVVACAIPSGACYTYHAYQIGGPGGRELGNQPATEWQGKTLHAFAWGAVRQDLPIENCQLGSGQRLGMEEVKVSTNFAYLLASIVTLGIWVPLKVSWRCARPPVIADTLSLDNRAQRAWSVHSLDSGAPPVAPVHALDNRAQHVALRGSLRDTPPVAPRQPIPADTLRPRSR